MSNGVSEVVEERGGTTWSVRVPELWDQVLDEAISRGVIMHKSEFLRKAAEKEFERLGLPLRPRPAEDPGPTTATDSSP